MSRHTAVAASKGAMIHVLVVAFLLIMGQCARGATSGYVDAKRLAGQHAMQYRDLSSEGLHACKLMTRGHSVLVTCGLKSVLVDGAMTSLSKPVLWEGGAIRVPAETANILAGLKGVKEASPSAKYASAYRVNSGSSYETDSGNRIARPRPFKVVIDPGHGGKDPGCSYGGVHEKTVNLDIAHRLAGYLQGEGITVVWTRQRDVSMSPTQRVNVANRNQPDLFLSVHANAELSKKQRGAMVLYPAEGPPQNKPDLLGRSREVVESRTFNLSRMGAGGSVAKPALIAVAGAAFGGYRVQSIDVAKRIESKLVPISGRAKTRTGDGLLEDYRGLRLLCKVQAPVVIAEVDFLSNFASRRKLATSAYRDKIAKALADAVVDFRDNGDSD